jgi:hypothetical protein
MVAHETQGFILVQGVVYANPYCSGAATLVFVCSITKTVTPSYEVNGIGERLDPGPEVPTLPTLLYIGRKVRITERTIRITERTIGLTDYVLGLLQEIDHSYYLDMSVSVCLDLYVGRPNQSLWAFPPRLLDRLSLP